jgi:hypothetical protein
VFWAKLAIETMTDTVNTVSLALVEALPATAEGSKALDAYSDFEGGILGHNT